MNFDLVNWILLYLILTFLGVGNTYMVKYSANRISWQENLTFSRVPVMFYDIYLILKYFKFQHTTAHVISFLSGVLVIISLPFTYYLLKKLDISRYYPMGALTIGLIVLIGIVIMKESCDIKKIVGIILSIGAIYFLMKK